MPISVITQLRSTKTLLSPEQLAPLVGLEIGSLAARRTRGQAPAFIKVGALVRYDPSVVADWLDEQTVTPTPAPASALPGWLEPTRNKSITSGAL